MEKLTMCRICLVENVSMYEVANKNLQRMYEKLIDIPFVTKDSRPLLACFFCYSKLKQCWQLQKKCLKAEEVFAQMLNGDYKQIPLEFQGEIQFCGGFIKTPIEHMNIDDVCQESGAITELPAVCDIKKEYQFDEVKVEYLDQKDVPSHHSESDSEYEVPLMNFKIEVEEEPEIPEETRAPVAKKSKLDIRKAKLEDTITDKQKKKRLSGSATRNKTIKSISEFIVPIISDTIAKPNVNNSVINKDEMIKESLNKESVTEVINTAIDTNYRNNSKSNEDNFECKIINNSDDINKHQKVCKIHKCDICQRSFNKKSHLDKHVLIHTGEKPYECDICQLSFTYKSSLNGHIRIHTGEKPYKCDICQRSFRRQSNLKQHTLIHTGEKPHKCNICNRSFSGKSNLYTHIRIHVNEKPHKCDICQRTFTQKAHLKSHHRSHTGEKPYKCDICQRSFINQSNLNKHNNRTH